jgi:hypothetical protein
VILRALCGRLFLEIAYIGAFILLPFFLSDFLGHEIGLVSGMLLLRPFAFGVLASRTGFWQGLKGGHYRGHVIGCGAALTLTACVLYIILSGVGSAVPLAVVGVAVTIQVRVGMCMCVRLFLLSDGLPSIVTVGHWVRSVWTAQHSSTGESSTHSSPVFCEWSVDVAQSDG